MNLFTISFNNNEPLYLQLYKNLKNDIINGKLLPNEQLPSKRKLSTHLNISLNTVLQAYNLLIDEGFIVTKEKIGYFVLDYNLSLKSKENISIIKDDLVNPVKYDLTTKNIDYTSFPIYNWTKITKNILSNNFDILKKTNGKGDTALRKTISKYLYETKGLIVNYENIIIGSGIEYLLTIIVNLLDAKTYAIEDPGYDKIAKILQNNNKIVNYIPINKEGIDVSALLKTNSEIVYTTPANQFPTGIKMTLQRKIQLINWVKISNHYIIEDDFDSEFKFFSKSSNSFLSFNPEKTIFISTYSRTLSPALRISYTILPDKLLEVYNKKYNFYSSTVSTIDQLILKEFIASGSYSRHLNKTKTLYKKKRDLIISLLENENDLIEIDYINSYLSLNINIKKNINRENFINQIHSHGIDINFVDNFSFTGIKNNWLIVGYSGIDINILKEAINLLLETIKLNIL